MGSRFATPTKHTAPPAVEKESAVEQLSTVMEGITMESLLSSPIAPAVLIVGALLLLVLAWKVFKGMMKLAKILVFLALMIAAGFWLNEMGFFGG
jgi:hypothetical protein